MDRTELAEQAHPEPTARSEWLANLPLVAASMVGLSLATVAIYALGQFVEPLEAEFGWSRAEIMAGASMQSFATFALSAFMGRFIDKYNARYIAIPGVILCALSIASFSLIDGDLRLWLGLWFILAAVGMLTTPILWLASISAAFEKDRSLAMAVTLAGLGLGSTFAPALARYLIDEVGWRQAFQLLGLTWGGVSLLLTLAFFFDKRKASERSIARETADTPKASIASILLSGKLITFAAAVFGTMLIISALMLNLAPLLVDGGFGRSEAAYLAGVAGMATILGKLFAGSLLDRVRSSFVTTGTMISLAMACFLLQHSGWHVAVAALACLSLGVAAGAMSTIMACMTAKIFRPEDFGTIYGSLISVMSFGAMVGPFLAGLAHDAVGTYDLVLWSGVCIAVVSALLMKRLQGKSTE